MDKDLSAGTPVRKKPLGAMLPKYSYWRTAIPPLGDEKQPVLLYAPE
jgi:hypothetical protein